MKKHYILLVLKTPDIYKREKADKEQWKTALSDLKKTANENESITVLGDGEIEDIGALHSWLIPRNKGGLSFVAQCISLAENQKYKAAYQVWFLDEENDTAQEPEVRQ